MAATEGVFPACLPKLKAFALVFHLKIPSMITAKGGEGSWALGTVCFNYSNTPTVKHEVGVHVGMAAQVLKRWFSRPSGQSLSSTTHSLCKWISCHFHHKPLYQQRLTTMTPDRGKLCRPECVCVCGGGSIFCLVTINGLFSAHIGNHQTISLTQTHTCNAVHGLSWQRCHVHA